MRPRLLLMMLVCLPLLTLAQSKHEKFLRKAEASYATGDYGKSFKYLAKFKKKTTKKLGAQNQYTPIYYLSLAKYNLASGLIADFETNLQSALTALDARGDQSEAAVQLLIDAGALHSLNGSFRKGRELLDLARTRMRDAQLEKDPLLPRWKLAYAETLAGQGYYNNALELLDEIAPFFAGRSTARTETYVENGALKSRKLPEEEYTARAKEYANLLAIYYKTVTDMGYKTKSDSMSAQASKWIDDKLGRYSMEAIRFKFYDYNYLVDNGVINRPDYGKLLSNLKANHKPSHYLATQIYEAYLRLLLKDGSNRYYNVKLEYEKLINHSFKSTSIYAARLKAIEFDSRLSRDNTKGLQGKAMNVLTNTPGLPKYNLITANINNFLGELALFERRYADGENFLREVVNIKKELFGDEAPETHLARIALANYYLDYTNNIAEAEKIYTDSYIGVVEPQIRFAHKDHLNILGHLADLYELTDRYGLASQTLTKGLDFAYRKYDPKDPEYGVMLTRTARLQIKLGDYDNAEAQINKALKILEDTRRDDVKNLVYLVNAIETQAVLLGIKGLYDDAEDALAHSKKLTRGKDNLVGLDPLATAREMSSLYIQLGRYSETETLLKTMLAEYEKQYGKNSRRLIEPLVNLGRLTLLKGDYTEADKIALRANDIAVTNYGEVSTKTAQTQKLLSDIDYQIGDFDRAEANILKALKSQEKQFGRNHIEVAKALAQHALIKFYKGDNRREVEKIMLEARDIIGTKLSKDNPTYAEVLKNVAVINIAEKKYEVALGSLTQAANIWVDKSGKKSIHLASIHALAGDVFYHQKKYKDAERYYNTAKDVYEKYFSKNHPEYVRVLSRLAKVYYQEKQFKQAKRNIEEALANYEAYIKQFFPALSEREKAKYWNTIKGDFEFYNTLAFSQLDDFRDLSGKVYSYQLLTKALLLSSSIKVRERILNSKDEALKDLYNTWVQKKEFLTSALSMSTQQLQDNGINTEQLTGEVEKLERELSEKSELFGQGFENKRITYENVQKSLGKNEVAVEILRYRHFDHTFTDSVIYVALYVKNDNARPKVIGMPEGHRMETRFLRYYRTCINGKIPDEYSYKVFWEPIQKEIGQYSTIYISPDGVYNQINLEAIPIPGLEGKYVIDNSNIVMVSNTKDLYLRKQKAKATEAVSAKHSATMIGNPTFYTSASADRTWSQLPGTEKEVKQLADLLKQKGWSATEYLEAMATEEQVKSIDNPNVFHIATHGFYTAEIEPSGDDELTSSEAMLSENPLMKTGLLLKGGGDLLNKTKYNYNQESGILTAYEAMNLNLDKTDMVVLSACETGLGDIHNGEGVQGLQRAFLVAGAKVLIMSMFKVDDDATQALIVNYYRKWLATGNMRQSFVEAKKELRAQYPEPIYWGAFMMIGLE